MISLERSQRAPTDTPWWWLRGHTYPHRHTLKRSGCRWSKRQQAWYFIGQTLPDAVQALIDPPPDDDPQCSQDHAAATLDVTLAPDLPLPADPPIPNIRILKPMSNDAEAAAITAVIPQTRAAAALVLPSSAPSSGQRSFVRIPQAPCGELTGSVTGSVWCYGWAVHDGVCVYLNMGGPRMAVEAIRAKLAKGDIVSCVPWDAPSVELTAGEGNTGMYTAFTQNIPEAKFTSMILLHEMLTQPTYGGQSTTFILHVSDEQAMAQLHQHVMKLVKVPVFPDWTSYLWQAGQAAMLVRCHAPQARRRPDQRVPD